MRVFSDERKLIMIRLFLIISIQIILLSHVVLFIPAAADTGAQVLAVVPDARPIGMGGAFCAISGDAASIFYNPAGLAVIRHTEIPLAKNYLFKNIDNIFKTNELEYYGLVYSFRDVRMANIHDIGTIAVTWNKMDTGYIPGKSAVNDKSNKDSVLTIAYGWTIFERKNNSRITAGVSAKFFEDKTDNGNSEGSAFDVGMQWKLPGKNLFLGAAVRNIGSKIRRGGEKLSLPCVASLGISGKMLQKKLTVGIDLNKPVHDSITANIGSEYWFLKTMALRLGYNSAINPDSGLTAGFGVKLQQLEAGFFYIREIAIDYAYPTGGELEDMHRLSVNIKLGVD